MATSLHKLPPASSMSPMSQREPEGNDRLLATRELQMHFPIQRGFLRRTVGHVRAVDGVTFDVRRGETLALVGESGSGKTTVARCLLRVYTPTGGAIHYTRADGTQVDLAALDEHALRPFRREIRMIFQDPYASLNPRMSVLEIVSEPLVINGVATGDELQDRVAQLLRRVGLRPEYMRRYPHAFSGGERQRIGIARALALNPRLVVADEAVSALDVSVRSQVLNLLQDLQAESGLTYLFISHDMSVVEYLADRVAVMYVGQVVEQAPTARLFAAPRHPYTEALLSAVPKPNPRLRGQPRIVLQGEVADPANKPTGCAFHPRCRYAIQQCRDEVPTLRADSSGHLAACHRADELVLQGVTRVAA